MQENLQKKTDSVKLCEICGNNAIAKGLCKTHYMKKYRYGDAAYEKQPKEQAEYQFCSHCQESYALDSDHWTGKKKRVCKKYAKEYNAAYRKKNVEKLRNQEKLRRDRNPEEYRRKQREWTRASENKRKTSGYYIKWRYGITLEQFEDMLKEQDGKCKICGTTSPGGRGSRFCIDHDHTTGKVRGLLCASCNWAIGHLRDKPETAIKAAHYLEQNMSTGGTYGYECIANTKAK